jgi:hypothetical protein
MYYTLDCKVSNDAFDIICHGSLPSVLCTVHELCYATVPTECKNPNFTCHACKSVGTEVEVNVPSRVGGCKTGSHREMMKQETRPMECALCSVKSGIHAMHPLSDISGSEGRQLVLPATGAGFKRKEKRLAWVHTLCAQYICTTTGYIYGLFEGGGWEGQEDEEQSHNEEDEQNQEENHAQKYEIGTEVSKEFEEGWFDGKVTEYRYDEDEGEYLYAVLYEDGDKEDYNEKELEEILISRKEPHSSIFATESFCFLTGVDKKTGVDADKNVKEVRELKCTICNSNDSHSLRLPVQCMAYDPNEFKEFKKCHRKIKGVTKPECTLAVHVGCARWATKKFAGVKGKSLRMCYFYPGQKVRAWKVFGFLILYTLNAFYSFIIAWSPGWIRR